LFKGVPAETFPSYAWAGEALRQREKLSPMASGRERAPLAALCAPAGFLGLKPFLFNPDGDTLSATRIERSETREGRVPAGLPEFRFAQCGLQAQIQHGLYA
jgi:hypothetical protein